MTRAIVPRVIRTVAPRVTVREVGNEHGAAAAARYRARAKQLVALSLEEAHMAARLRADAWPAAADEAEERAELHHREAKALERAAAAEERPWEPHR